MEKYHKYLFDFEKKNVVGDFEQMYQNEDIEGFDSWYEQSITKLRYSITNSILNNYNFSSVLDIGCGKGSLTQFFKKENNKVLGIDISSTAIKKAQIKYPNIGFKVMDLNNIKTINSKFSLVTVTNVFAFVENYKDIIGDISKITKYFFISEYIPPDPIGYVKSSKELFNTLVNYFEVIHRVYFDEGHCMFLLISK